ncbi:hypothetical protein [Tenacibaculum geojense]|uniref:RiboL-PSP-HEPN domain-containing protein n=1 Tax=Tenacibaculum geojense TaxID=915352 RepID=A0ABW3JNH5_9FLAO
MHFTHIKLKPTKKINKDFNLTDAVKDIEIPEESKQDSKKFHKTNKLSDELGWDLLIEFEDSIIYAFDYLNVKEKVIIPELNPTTIFYSNAIMFHRNLITTKKNLLEKSPTLKELHKPIDPKIFGNFFQFATNCIINLQSTIESFANRQIPDNYFINEKGEEYDVSIFHKIDTVLPVIKGKKFKREFKRDNFRVRKVIELRNEIIHLKPIKDSTNTQYKATYRKMIKFDFTRAIIAVKKFVNFYEPELIEECICGKEYYYDLEIKEKEE